MLGLVLYQLTLAHDIAAVAPTCRALCDAAKLALKLRPFSSKVVELDTRLMCGVATTLDGHVVTGSGEGIVQLWRDGACERTFEAHTNRILSVAVLPGGSHFVSASDDKTAKLWTLDGALERTFEMPGLVYAVAALPDGSRFVVASATPQAALDEFRLYHVDGTLIHTFKEGVGPYVCQLAVTPDGQHLAAGGANETVKVWNLASKSLVSTCVGHSSDVRAVAAMPDSQRILSGSYGVVWVWLLDGTRKNVFTGLHYNAVFALVALPDNQHALSASLDATVKLFNVNDGAALRTFEHHTSWMFSLALLPDGLRFISASDIRKTRIAYHGLAP